MILYVFPGACSLANHIALIEAGIPHQLDALTFVDGTKRTSDGRDFRSVNPRGYVPALELEDGAVLTENLAILMYVASLCPTLLPADGLARWRVLEATSFMTTEIHGNFKPFFYPDATSAEKNRSREKLTKHFATLGEQLGERPFLIGDQMSFADPYLFVMLMWAQKHDIPRPSNLDVYFGRLRRLPSVKKALAEEGLW